MNLHCPKCLSGRTGIEIGQKCDITPGCDGIIERQPEWKELVDRLPEAMTCPRRMRDFGPWEHEPYLDYWEQFKVEHKHRVCSFCGSLHFEDFAKLVALAANQSEDADRKDCVEIEFSDKNYKVYVHVPGIRNAHQGGIKFYMWHCPKKDDGSLLVSQEQQDQLKEATRRSRIRFNRYLDNLHV